MPYVKLNNDWYHNPSIDGVDKRGAFSLAIRQNSIRLWIRNRVACRTRNGVLSRIASVMFQIFGRSATYKIASIDEGEQGATNYIIATLESIKGGKGSIKVKGQITGCPLPGITDEAIRVIRESHADIIIE